jgi:hypothetical protein
MDKYKKEVKPRRFVYHVTSQYCRPSILKEGLTGSDCKVIDYRNAIFAHNDSFPGYHWYPFCHDVTFFWKNDVRFMDPDLDFAYHVIKEKNDFWRIDTWKIKNKWFLDTPGMRDFHEEVNVPLMVVTFENIPLEALKLYRLYLEPKVIYCKGSAHIEGYFRAA